jgi:hypothetical protein
MKTIRENFAGSSALAVSVSELLASQRARRSRLTANSVQRDARSRRGSVLIIVLVTMLFAVAALTLFLEKASTDLIVATRDATDTRLRAEAYSALETTVAVLVDFKEVLGGLRSPSEGWSAPLEFAGYEPGPDREVTVTFEDESGKISLPTVDAPTLINLFKGWELSQPNAEKLSDALLGWMKKEHTPSSVSSPTADDYARGDLPYQPPSRPLRSFSELAAIEYAREVFYDEKGNPNDLWHRFVSTFSLYQYKQPNINAAAPDLLLAYGANDPQQQTQLRDFTQGSGLFQASGPGVFKSAADIATVLGARSPAAAQVGTEIAALRVIVTVKEGLNQYQLAALFAPPGGARPPGPGSLNRDKKQGDGESGEATAAPPAQSQANGSSSQAAVKSLNYPFTLLEIRENGAIPKSAISSSPSP